MERKIYSLGGRALGLLALSTLDAVLSPKAGLSCHGKSALQCEMRELDLGGLKLPLRGSQKHLGPMS